MTPLLPIIGITGGVATGKSAVTRIFARHGAICFSADEAARAVLAPRNLIVQQIEAAFGPDAVGANGLPDRAWLGALIFRDETARHCLEAILHPPILRLLRAQIEAARSDFFPPAVPAIAVEVPLLYETGMESWFDRVVVVRASPAVQLQRLQSRNHLDETSASRRIAAQWSLAEKAARAHIVIDNDGDLAQTEQQVKNFLKSKNFTNFHEGT